MANEPEGDITYLRFAVRRRRRGLRAGATLDDGIVRAVWLSLDELRHAGAPPQPADPQCVRGITGGPAAFPLDLLRHYDA